MLALNNRETWLILCTISLPLFSPLSHLLHLHLLLVVGHLFA